MKRNNSFNRHSFFFRTKAQFRHLQAYAGLLSDAATKTYKLPPRQAFGPAYAHVESVAWEMTNIRDKMPKEKPGKKKYIATLVVSKRLEALLDDNQIAEDVDRLIQLEPVPSTPNKPKYNEEDITRAPVRLKGPMHFRKLVSLLNAEYGNGNWHLRGAKKILAKLEEAERIRVNGNKYNTPVGKQVQEILDGGLKVDVVVTSKVDNLKPLLFKIQLMS